MQLYGRENISGDKTRAQMQVSGIAMNQRTVSRIERKGRSLRGAPLLRPAIVRTGNPGNTF